MCCAGSSAARFVTATCSARISRSSIRWSARSTQEMGEAFPELRAQRSQIERVLKQEEERFAETLSQGMALLDQALTGLRSKEIPGDTVFKLYDTFGFPVDLTADIARERGLTIDQPGFEAAMQAQRERGRAASKFGVDLRSGVSVEGKTSFSGYEHVSDTGTVVALLRDKQRVEALRAGEDGQVILDHTPFYAESGGQVGDSGALVNGAARVRGRGHAEARWRLRAHRAPDARPAAGGRPPRSARRRGPAPRHRAESFCDAPVARGAAQGARHARDSEGLAGRTRPAALRLLALRCTSAPRSRRKSSDSSTRRSAATHLRKRS